MHTLDHLKMLFLGSNTDLSGGRPPLADGIEDLGGSRCDTTPVSRTRTHDETRRALGTAMAERHPVVDAFDDGVPTDNQGLTRDSPG